MVQSQQAFLMIGQKKHLWPLKLLERPIKDDVFVHEGRMSPHKQHGDGRGLGRPIMST